LFGLLHPLQLYIVDTCWLRIVVAVIALVTTRCYFTRITFTLVYLCTSLPFTFALLYAHGLPGYGFVVRLFVWIPLRCHVGYTQLDFIVVAAVLLVVIVVTVLVVTVTL